MARALEHFDDAALRPSQDETRPIADVQGELLIISWADVRKVFSIFVVSFIIVIR